ncbi:MAG: hypothetical protein Q8N42_01505 [bacterium]|nr:hypothetical protein [bacterium]
MGVLIFAKDYLVWHYSQALKEGFVIWKTFLWFVSQLFSIRLLLRTLFSPWRRLKEYYGRGFDPVRLLESLFINIMMRFIGFIIRSVAILVGLAAELAAIIIGIIMFVVWLAFPFFIILFLSRGIMIFF